MKKKILISIIIILILLCWVWCYFYFNNTEDLTIESSSNLSMSDISYPTTEDNSNEITEKTTDKINEVLTIKDFNPEDFNNVLKDEEWNIRVLSNIIEGKVEWVRYSFYPNWNIYTVEQYRDWELDWVYDFYYEEWNIMSHWEITWNGWMDYFYTKEWEFIWSWTINLMKSCSFEWCMPYVTIRDWIDVFYYEDNNIREIQKIKSWVPTYITYYTTTWAEMWSLEYGEYLPYSWVEYDFYSDGTIEYEIHYSNWVNNWPYLRYFENGSIQIDRIYKDDKIIKNDIYNEGWELIEIWLFDEEWNKIWSRHFINWKLRKDIIQDENYKLIKIILYDENWDIEQIIED